MTPFSKFQKYFSTVLSGIIFFLIFNGSITAAPTNMSQDVFNKSGMLSFYFQNIEVRTLLQLIAKNSGMNFIISDLVKGSTTLNLKNVTWQEALDIILQSQGLAARRLGNVMLIGTIDEITTNQAKKLQSAETIANLEPLSSTIIQLRYTDATDMATLLKTGQSTLLTSRGQVAVDKHTNSIILRDVKNNLRDVKIAIKRLDIPARQVLIEARIVTIDVDFEKELGARFGISNPNHLSGTFFGANSLAQGTTLPNVTQPGGTIDPTQRLNFNTPALASGVFGATPGSIGLAVAKVAGVYLDMELSALEGENHLEIIASPRVMTSNQQKAVIKTGEEIPYQESTSSGATSVTFKDAVLSLEIVPQITPNNKIILDLKATEDTRGTDTLTAPGGSAVPSINTQAVSSNVLLNNNETIVVGGVYTQTKRHQYERIPFLGSIPVIGYLFKHSHDENRKQELLIFLTPKIISPLSAAPYKNEG